MKCSGSGGVWWGECWRQSGAGGEELAEGVEFVDAPFGGGGEVGVDEGEVGEAVQGAPASAAPPRNPHVEDVMNCCSRW
jgi:hypothetical protein